MTYLNAVLDSEFEQPTLLLWEITAQKVSVKYLELALWTLVLSTYQQNGKKKRYPLDDPNEAMSSLPIEDNIYR